MTAKSILAPVALTIALMTGVGAAWADAPPASCGAASGCNLGSDWLVFADGDATFQVTAHITACGGCTYDAQGDFQFFGSAQIDFGPYDPGINSCAPGTDKVTVNFSNAVLSRRNSAPLGLHYVPRDPATLYPVDAVPALRTACVATANLDYLVPRLFLSGAEGATTDLKAGPSPAALVLPESVRGIDATGLISRVVLDRFRFAQNLRFSFLQDETQFSSLRFWPDGLPFRLGPDQITFDEQHVSFTSTGPPNGPARYTVAPPAASNLTLAQVRKCDPGDPEPLPGAACTGSRSIGNGGYFEAGWVPSSPVQFGNQGMSVSLTLGAADSMVYQPLFPQGVWVKLNGPAAINIESSQIVAPQGQTAAGAFADGTGWLDLPRDKCPTGPTFRRRKFALNGGANQPLVGAGGRLLAGVADLNQLDATTLLPQRIDWTYNEAVELGCGSLFVPGILTDDSPQKSWNASAVPPVLGRGVYAGLNFNRNRVCTVVSEPQYQPTKFCSGDGDCDTAQDETCVDGGYSPRCPAAAPPAKWKTTLDAHPLTFSMAGQGDREMAFLARASGVTGVFDAGDDLNLIVGNPQANPPEFIFAFDTFGLAFKESRSERADTIVDGDLVVDWPSATDIPLRDMQVCDCGTPDSARTPDVLLEKKLLYWDAAFSPYGVTFSQSSTPNCPGGTLASSTCPQDGSGESAQSAAIDALTPVPRFSPDPDSCIGLVPSGQAGPIVPYSVSRLQFDKDGEATDGTPAQKAYLYDVEQFALSDWTASGAPPRQAVIPSQGQPATADYGFYDASGDLLLPFFGLEPAGVMIGIGKYPGTNAHADLHQECLPQDPNCALDPGTSFIWARRKLAADHIEIPFRVDYLGADATADPADGWNDPATPGVDDLDRPGKSRGTLFAFAAEEDADPANELNLGSVKVAGGMLMTPDDTLPGAPEAMRIRGGDLGPAAAVRLWGAAKPAARGLLRNVFPCDATVPPCPHVDDWGAAYDLALARLATQAGYQPWSLPDADTLRLDLHGPQQAIDTLANHPDFVSSFDVESTPPGKSPPMVGSGITGSIHFSPVLQQLEALYVASNLDTGGQFFGLDASVVTIDRHVKTSEQAITQFAKEDLPDAAKNMALPAKQDLPFDGGLGMQWDFDYSITPNPPFFQFNSLAGSIDLAQGAGMSGVGPVDKLGASLKFWNDGDWYFTAGIRANVDGNSFNGDILLGNTKDMTPLQDIDWNVAAFLEGIPALNKGAYVKVGGSVNIWDTGCLLRITAGGEVGGWYFDNTFGGKWRGYISGKAGCLVSIKGDMTLIGGVKDDLFQLQGTFWVAGGAGFCDEDDWTTPEAVLDDDFCVACVASMTGRGHYPPKDMDVTFEKDYLECAGP